LICVKTAGQIGISMGAMGATRFAAILLAVVPSGALADPGFWAGADIGAASLKRSFSVTGSTQASEFAMAFRAGYSWDPRLLLGVELGGWTLEPGNTRDPAHGEGIRTLYAIAQFYPAAGARLFVKGGFGEVKYWNNRPGENGASGTGGMLGAGYDFPLSGSWYVTPAIDYARGKYDGAVSPPGITQDQSYRAVTLRIGVTYR
jgi:hypothetical protein